MRGGAHLAVVGLIETTISSGFIFGAVSNKLKTEEACSEEFYPQLFTLLCTLWGSGLDLHI